VDDAALDGISETVAETATGASEGAPVSPGDEELTENGFVPLIFLAF
jgi:hypothetical protein